MDPSRMSSNPVMRRLPTNQRTIANTTSDVTTALQPLQITQTSLEQWSQFRRKPEHSQDVLLPRERSTIIKHKGITVVTTPRVNSNIEAVVQAGGIKVAELRSGFIRARVYMYQNTLFCFILNADELASARLIIDEKDQDIQDQDYYTQPRCVLYPEEKDHSVYFNDVKKSGKKYLFDFAENLMIFVSSLVLDFTQEISPMNDDLDEEEAHDDLSAKRKHPSMFKRNENNFFRDILHSIICHETRFYVYAFYDVVCRIDVEKIDTAITILANALPSWLKNKFITDEQQTKIINLILEHKNFCQSQQGSCYRLFNLDKKIIPTELLRDSIETELQTKVQTMLKMKEGEARREILTRYGAAQPITDVEWCPELEAIFATTTSEASSEEQRLKPYSSLLAHNVHQFLKGHTGSRNKIKNDRNELFCNNIFNSVALLGNDQTVTIQDYVSSSEDESVLNVTDTVIKQTPNKGLLKVVKQALDKNDSDKFFVKIEELFQNHFTDWKKSSDSAIPKEIRLCMTDLMTNYLFAVKTVELVVSFRVYPLLPAHQSSLCTYKETTNAEGKQTSCFSVENTICKDLRKHNEYKNKILAKLSDEQQQRQFTTSGRKHDMVQSSTASNLCKLNIKKIGKKTISKEYVLDALFTDRPEPTALVPKNLDGYRIDTLDTTSKDTCYWFVQNKNQSFCTIPIRDELKHIIESSKYGYNISCFAQCLLTGTGVQNSVPLSQEAQTILQNNTSKLSRIKIVLPTHITYTQTFVTHLYNEQGSQGYIEKLNSKMFQNDKFLRFNVFLNIFENCTSTEKIRVMDITHPWIPCWHMDDDGVQMLLHQFGPFGLAFKKNTDDEVTCAPSGDMNNMIECKNNKKSFLDCLNTNKCTGPLTKVFADYMEENHFNEISLHDIQRVLSFIVVRKRPYNFIKRCSTHLGLNILLLALSEEVRFEDDDAVCLNLNSQKQFEYLFLENKVRVLEDQDNVMSLYIIFVYACVYTAFILCSHFKHLTRFTIDDLEVKESDNDVALKNLLQRNITTNISRMFPDCEYVRVVTPDFFNKCSDILIPTKEQIENQYENVYDWLYKKKYGSEPLVREAVDFEKIRKLALEILQDEDDALDTRSGA